MLTVGTIHGPSCERTVSRVRFRDELGLAISNTASMKHKVRNMHTHLVRTVLCKNAPQRTNGGMDSPILYGLANYHEIRCNEAFCM